MTEAAENATPDLTPFTAERLSEVMHASERRFWSAVAVAALFHALLLIGFTSAEPRRIGSPEGAERGISISMVSPEELKGYATVDDSAASAPPPPLKPSQKPEDTAPTPPEKQVPTKEKSDQTKDASRKPAAAEPKPRSEPDASSQPVDGLRPPPAAETKPREQTATPAKPNAAKKEAKQEPKSPAEQQRTPKPQPPKEKTAKLDLRVPPSQFAGRPGAGSGVQRPPGITRSGENDEFARGVIRALQRTMPQFAHLTRGRVTVRIRLNKSGNLVNTEVVRPSNVKGLDQSVVFATHQASFPLPPVNANKADLIFLVTYVYR